MSSKSLLSAVIRRGRLLSHPHFENCLGIGSGRRVPAVVTVTFFSQRVKPNFSEVVRRLGGVSDFHTGRSHWSNTSPNRGRSQITCSDCAHSYPNDADDFVNSVICPKCGTLQKLERSELPNYFQILEHTKSYRVDLTKLANKTKNLQKLFHPDLFGGKGEDQQILSQEYSSLINKAVSTLTSPIERGRYLLYLGGIDVTDPSTDLEKATTNDPYFLDEIMMLNEELEELSSVDHWKEFKRRNDQKLEKFNAQVANAFELNDLDEAYQALGRLKYYDTIHNKLKELQSRIGIVE